MGGEDSLGVTTGQPNLHKQDLSKLDVSKLTPLSEEVISRQATINIGTIGHVAHGKSTIVKAISGVQTVRFKNELERNITIKLEARDVETGNGEMADVPDDDDDDDTNNLPKFCEKRSRDTSENSTPPSKRSKSTSKSEKVYCLSPDRGGIHLSSASPTSARMNLREVRVCISPIKKPNDTPHNSSMTDANTFEVEKVLDKKIKDGRIYYLIKWKGWTVSHNTWEPEDNLSECVDLVSQFDNSRAQLLERFKRDGNYFPTVERLQQLMAMKVKDKQSIDEPNTNDEAMYVNLKAFYGPSGQRNIQTLKAQIKKQILDSMFWSLRRDQLDSLNDWEEEINSITQGKPKIQIINRVDFESAPQDFFYIDDYLPGSGVIIPDEPPIGCECRECSSKTKCCYAQCDGSFPYTSAGRVRIPPGTPIYECNKRCRCSASCKNRVVQRGSNVDLCIFRTSNGRGWGVKTMSAIKKGTFITQYVGEVITSEEAEKRGKEYDAAGRTYLFDLDYNASDDQCCPYTVDAAMYGNISHFINHSCDPNSAVYAVWIDCLDPNLPKLALFATRDIIANEEITFNYMRESPKALEKKIMNSPIKTDGESDTARQRLELPGDRGQSGGSGKTRCKCGSKCCRQWLF